MKKQDIIKHYGISPNLIDVVYNGANDIYKPLKITEKEKIKAFYSENKDYFLFIGAIHPRKNLGNILKAFDIFKEKTKSKTKFLVAGRKAWQSKNAFEIYQNMKYKDEELIRLGTLISEKYLLPEKHLGISSRQVNYWKTREILPFFEKENKKE